MFKFLAKLAGLGADDKKEVRCRCGEVAERIQGESGDLLLCRKCNMLVLNIDRSLFTSKDKA